MADTLWDLAARITADTASAERGLTATQQKVLDLAKQFSHLDDKTSQSSKRVAQSVNQIHSATTKAAASGSNLRGVFQGLSSATTTLDGPLGSIAGRFSSIASLGAGVTSSAGAIGIAFGALAVATVGAGVGIFKLVQSVSEATGHLHDLSQRTNFSVETLSALQHAAETSGGSIETISSALGIFQRNMEEANDKNSEASRIFKALSIDVRDNEKALRQAFLVLSQMESGAQQTALSMKLFGRSGREVMAIFKEAGGDLDAFISKLRSDGLLVTGQMAAKGDELSDSITRIGQRFSAISRQVASEFAPMVERALTNFDSWLRRNSESIRETASQISNLIQWAARLSDALSLLSFKPFVIQVQLVASMVGEGWKWLGLGNLVPPSGAPVTGGTYMELDPKTGRNVRRTWGVPNQQGPYADQGEYVTPGSAVPRGLGRINIPTGGGGRGGGGARKQIDEVAEALKRYTREVDEAALGSDRYDKDINRLVESLAKKQKALTDTQRAQLTEKIETLRTLDATEAYTDFMHRLKEQLDDAQHSGDEWEKALREIQKTLAKSHRTLEDFVGAEERDIIAKLRLIDLLKKEAQAMQELNITRQRYADILRNTRQRRAGVPDNPDVDTVDLGGGSVYVRDRSGRGTTIPEDIQNQTRPRRVNQDEYDKHMQRVQDMARDITSALDNAIYEGFRGGVKRGLASLLTSMLDMIRNVLMKNIEAQLTDALSGISMGAGGKGKGGWLGWLFTAISGLAGGFGGGGGGGAGKAAAGGFTGGFAGFHKSGLSYVPFDNYPAFLHRGERVMTAQENSAGMGPVVINVYPRDLNSFMGRDTETQITNKMQTVMRRAAVRVN